jgi:hypothetical protein
MGKFPDLKKMLHGYFQKSVEVNLLSKKFFPRLTGYFSVAKETYDISWTMPHCVMCLRLIGLAMDVHDGQQKKPVRVFFFRLSL